MTEEVQKTFTFLEILNIDFVLSTEVLTYNTSQIYWLYNVTKVKQ